MLPFQKTSLYQQLLGSMEKIMDIAEHTQSPVFKKQVEIAAFTAMSELAKAFSEKESPHREKHLKAAALNIESIIAFMDLAGKKHQSEQKKLETLRKNILAFEKTQKRILILSVAVGQGHMSAAKAIAEGMEYQYGRDCHVEIVDFIEFISRFMNTVTKTSYQNLVKFAPGTYKFIYESSNKYGQFTKFMNQVNFPFMITKMKKFFDEKNPDIVVSTSPFWTYMATEMWKLYRKDAKFISIITDSITIHKSWMNDKTDYYIVANKDTAQVVEKMGIKKDKIKVTGFPVGTAFLKAAPSKEFLKKHRLDPKKFTILLLTSSQNRHRNEAIVKQLVKIKDANIVIVSGRDHKNQPKLEKIGQKNNVSIYGWTDKMPEFIKAANVVLTKAGGATVMECLAAGKPIIITSVIPGQEEGNAQLIEKYKLGLVLDRKSKHQDIVAAVKEIRKNQSTYQKNILKISAPKASLKIAEFIMKLI